MRGPRLRLLLTVLLLLSFSLTVLDARPGKGSPVDVLRRGAGAVLGPAERAVARALPGGGPDAETTRLQAENDQLRRQVVDLAGARAERDELAALLHLRPTGSYATVAARVVGYGASTPFETTVTLDVGSRDGVHQDATVLGGLGLVGRAVQVGPSTSIVALLTDPTVTIGCRLNAAPRSLGLATGSGRALTFSLLGDGAPLQVGDTVVTAGSDTFAAGIPVGRITAVAAADTAAVPTATLAPYTDLRSLDLLQVFVGAPAVPSP